MPSPSKFMVKPLNPLVAVCGDKASEEVISVQWDHKRGTLIRYVSVLKRRDTPELALSPSPLHTHAKERPCKQKQEGSHSYPRREAVKDTNPPGTLIWDLQPPEQRENGFPLFSVLPRLWSFVMEAREDEHNWFFSFFYSFPYKYMFLEFLYPSIHCGGMHLLFFNFFKCSSRWLGVRLSSLSNNSI